MSLSCETAAVDESVGLAGDGRKREIERAGKYTAFELLRSNAEVQHVNNFHRVGYIGSPETSH